MKCAELSALVAAKIEALRRELQAQVPGLVFVGLVVVDEHCDTQPGAMHVETQITTRPDFPTDMRADIMERAARQVREKRDARKAERAS